jgi:hypothetical protein
MTSMRSWTVAFVFGATTTACSRPPRATTTDSAIATPAAETTRVTTPADTTTHMAGSATALPDSIGRVHGDSLELRLTDGRAITLVSNPTDLEGHIEYQYAGIIGRREYYLLIVHYYESVGCELIDARTGERTKIVGAPLLSPSDSLGVATGYNLGIGEGPDAIEVWRILPHPATLLWSMTTTSSRVGGWGASAERWSGDSLIFLTRHVLLEGPQKADFSFPERQAPMRLVRRGGDWIVDTTTH